MSEQQEKKEQERRPEDLELDEAEAGTVRGGVQDSEHVGYQAWFSPGASGPGDELPPMDEKRR